MQIAKIFELPLFAVNCNVKLLDTFQGQLILLDQDTNRFTFLKA
jgi:hypothetical protein